MKDSDKLSSPILRFTGLAAPEMLIVLGAKHFLHIVFVQNWKSWFYRKKANNSAINPKTSKIPRSFSHLMKKPSLQNRSFAASMSNLTGFVYHLFNHFQSLTFSLRGGWMTGLSIDSKLPIVAYATAFDHFAMCCQLLLLSIILGILGAKIAEIIKERMRN